MSRLASIATVAVAASALFPAGCTFQANGDGSSDVVVIFDASRGGPDAELVVTPDAVAGEIPVVHAAYRFGGSNVDGRTGNDYNNATPVSWYLNPSSGQYAEVDGYASSMSATMRVIYNDNYVFFFIGVTDSQREHEDSDPPNLNDAVMLYLDMDDELDGPVSSNDRQFLVDTKEHELVFVGSSDPNPDSNSPYFRTSVRNEASNNVPISGYELRLKREDFWPANVTSVGFNVALYDDADDIAEDQTSWFPDAYGLWFKSFAAPCANCCGADEYPKAACDSTLLGRLQLDPPPTQ